MYPCSSTGPSQRRTPVQEHSNESLCHLQTATCHDLAEKLLAAGERSLKETRTHRNTGQCPAQSLQNCLYLESNCIENTASVNLNNWDKVWLHNSVTWTLKGKFRCGWSTAPKPYVVVHNLLCRARCHLQLVALPHGEGKLENFRKVQWACKVSRNRQYIWIIKYHHHHHHPYSICENFLSLYALLTPNFFLQYRWHNSSQFQQNLRASRKF